MGNRLEFPNLIRKNILIETNSADPDEMQHYAAIISFVSSLFAKVPLRGIQFTK